MFQFLQKRTNVVHRVLSFENKKKRHNIKIFPPLFTCQALIFVNLYYVNNEGTNRILTHIMGTRK